VGPIIGGIVAEYYKDLGAAFMAMGAILLIMAPLVILIKTEAKMKEITTVVKIT